MTHGAGGPRGPTRPRLVLLDPPLHGPCRPPVAVFGLPALPGRAPRTPLPHLPDQPPRQPALADRRGRLLVGPVRRIKRQQLRRRPPRPTRGPAPHARSPSTACNPRGAYGPRSPRYCVRGAPFSPPVSPAGTRRATISRPSRS